MTELDTARILAELYDPLDPDRSDLDVYAAVVDELGARSVLDIGCGTGTFACLLATRGVEVVGVDPDGASLDVARGKPGAQRVRWVHGVAADLPPLQVDLATMTANVAQAIVGTHDWDATLRAAAARLRPGGHLVFETRDPTRQAWLGWTREHTWARTEVPGFGTVQEWIEVTEVRGPLVSFRATTVVDGTALTAHSTLRFRERDEVHRSLVAAGFEVAEVRDAPDRPGRELVFVARCPA